MKTSSFNVIIIASRNDNGVTTSFCKGAYDTFEEAYKKGSELLGENEIWIWDFSKLPQVTETQVR